MADFEQDEDELFFREWGSALPAPEEAAPLRSGLREQVLRRTESVLARRRLVRRLGALLAAGVLFGAGFLAGDRGEPDRPRGLVPFAPAKQSDPRPSTPAPAPPSPLELEALAAASGVEKRAHLLQEAGDRYLSEGSDVLASLRCYEQALDLLPAEEAGRWRTDESWLLIALKIDRQ